MLSAWLKAEADNIYWDLYLAGQAVYSRQRQRGEGKHNWMGKECYAIAQGNWKLEMKLWIF